MLAEKQLEDITNDIESASHCSLCRGTSTARNIREGNGPSYSNSFKKSAAKKLHRHSSSNMHHKFLLIYALVFLVFSPLVACLTHQSKPNESALSDTTSSKASNYTKISSESEMNYEDPLEDSESEEQNESTTLSSAAIKAGYENQSKKYVHNKPVSVPKVDLLTTTTQPRRATSGSCSSTVCEVRKEVEQANMDNIRKQILLRLKMDQEPNKTKTYPVLSKQLKEHFCKGMGLSHESCFGTKLPSVEYQSDDPMEVTFDEDFSGEQGTISEDEEVQYLSFDNRIYAFPSTTIKPRHKSHLIFQFTESQEMNNAVASAVLNIYVHSRKFLRASDMHLPKNLRLIDIEIAKVVKGSHKSVFKTFRNVSLPDVPGEGEFVKLNITQMVAEWFGSSDTSHGLAVKIFASKSGEPQQQSHRIVSLDAENLSTRPFIDILPRDQRKKRTKRSSLHCRKGSDEARCCRHELTVNFEDFGWDWIIAPKKYDANYCAGECKIAFMQQYAHTHVMQLSTAANPCCSPRKMTSMQLLYFDTQFNIVLGTIPNMIVEECFCS